MIGGTAHNTINTLTYSVLEERIIVLEERILFPNLEHWYTLNHCH